MPHQELNPAKTSVPSTFGSLEASQSSSVSAIISNESNRTKASEPTPIAPSYMRFDTSESTQGIEISQSGKYFLLFLFALAWVMANFRHVRKSIGSYSAVNGCILWCERRETYINSWLSLIKSTSTNGMSNFDHTCRTHCHLNTKRTKGRLQRGYD